MRILGVDWGEKRIGLALSWGELAEPFGVVGSIEELIRVAKEEGAEKIILGLPEGKHQKKVRRLGKELEKELGAAVVFRSEILSTGEALKRAIDSGKGKKARRELDSLAAAVLLQEYLDSEEN